MQLNAYTNLTVLWRTLQFIYFKNNNITSTLYNIIIMILQRALYLYNLLTINNNAFDMFEKKKTKKRKYIERIKLQMSTYFFSILKVIENNLYLFIKYTYF